MAVVISDKVPKAETPSTSASAVAREASVAKFYTASELYSAT